MKIKAAPMNLEMKNLMKKYIAIMAVMLCAMMPSQMNATHIVGGDMSFKCLGNDFYEVTLTLRRDCINGAEDAPFDEQAAVGIFDKTGRKLDFLGRLGILYMPFNGADTLRNNVPDCALDGDMICVSESVYKAQVYLPFREQGYVLTYQRCCRNGTLNNIVNPLETGATRTVCITPESMLECNSGPAFGDFPPIIACANEELVFDASAFDYNGNRLEYTLVRPYTGASLDYPKPQPPWNPPYDDFIEYATGFSADNPLGDGSPISIDPVTGVITATPTSIGQYLVGIEVAEYDGDELLSVTNRDFELNVRACGDYPKVAFEVEDNCAGLTIDVQNNTMDAVSYLWNFNHPSTDEQFQSTEENPGSFTYPEPGIYEVRLEATDADGSCVVDLIKTVSVFNSQLTSSFTSGNGCCYEGETEISLIATSEEPSADHEIASYEYEVVVNGGDALNLFGPVQVLEASCSDNIVVTLTTTSTSGCTASVTETITINEGLGIAEGFICMEEVTICNGDNVSVGPLLSNSTYEWSPSNPDLTDPLNPLFSPSETTVYTVVATDENGAQSTGTVTVNVVEGFDLAIMDVDGVECDLEVQLTAVSNRDDLVYEWSTSEEFTDSQEGNPLTFPLMTGTNSFYVKGTSPEGCEEVALILIESDRLDIDIDVTTEGDSGYNACKDDPAIVTVVNNAEDQNITVQWDPSDNITSALDQPSVEVIAVGDEELITLGYTVINDEQCTESKTVDIPVMRSISASITGETVSCNGSFNLLANSDGDGVTYEWSYNSDFDPILSTDANLPLQLEEGRTIYMRATVGETCMSEIISADLTLGDFEVSFTDGNGNALPSEICVGDELKINGSSTNASVTIAYGPSDNILSDQGGNMVTVGAISGQSEITIPYTATSSDGCEMTGEITISVGSVEQPTPTVMNIDCTTGEVMFKSGRPDGSVLWDFGDGNTSTDGDPTHTYASSGTYNVTLSSNSDYCKFDLVGLDPLEIPEFFVLNPISPADPSSSIVYCENDEVTISVEVSEGATLEWQDQDGNVLGSESEITFNPSAGPVSSVTVVATAEDPRCGMSMIEYTLEPYIFDLTPSELPEVMCPGEPIDLSIFDNTGANLSYSWSPAGVVNPTDGSIVTVTVDEDTDIVVSITNNDNGCTTERVFAVDVHEVDDLTAIADPDPNIYLCDEVVLTAEGNFSTYDWSNGVSGQTQSVEPTETTTYTVTATDANGCSATSSVTINVTTPECDLNSIFIPDAFTPNGDGANDQLLVRSNAIKEMDFFIVDRWGNEVFRSTDQRVGWNGKFNNDGRELHPDAYAWCLFARCSNGEEKHFVGNVTLIR